VTSDTKSTNITKHSRFSSPTHKASSIVQPIGVPDSNGISLVSKNKNKDTKNGKSKKQATPVKDLLLARTEMGRALLIAEYFIQVRQKVDESEKNKNAANLSMIDGAYYMDKLYPFYISTSHFESLEVPAYRQNRHD